jgi:hypothetical protein
MDSFVWTLQISSCFYMTGVISVIQWIHYPSFANIEREKFSAFHKKHINALGFIAGPAMVIELVTALWLTKSGNPFFILNALLVCLLWFITFFISVPLHNRLAENFDEPVWRKLLKTNYLRSFLWILRSLGFLSVLCGFTA